MSKIQLNLGSGIGLLKDFINVDIIPLKVVEEGYRYEQASITKLPFIDNFADYAYMSEVMEHFPIRILPDAMKEVCRVMKPKGKLIITTPDFNGIAKLWLETVGANVGKIKEFESYVWLAEIIYGNQAHDGEFHRCPMTPDYVNFVLRVAGFSDVKVWVWPRDSKPGKKYPGMRWHPNAIMRTDTIVAEAVK
jgi:predicted SAM-dependent methyltransferase